MRNRQKKGGRMSLIEFLLRTESLLKQDLAREKTKHTGAIFHYTSPEGLKGILENGKIWFSNARFLNDSSENNYIYTILPSSPDIYTEQLLDKKFFELITKIANSYIANDYCDIDDNRWWADHVYVASFSEDKDNLGLWNYYTKNQNSVGYNLGFITMPFDFDPPYFKFIHGEVIYEPKIQKDFIKNILLKYNELYVNHKAQIVDGSKEKQLFVKSFLDILELHNIFFKPSAYSGEKEYRCAIYNITNYAGMLPKTRITNGLLLPYFELPFEKDLLSTLRISPTGNAILLKQGLEIFNVMHGYENIVIYPSNIPKRY